MSNDTEDCKRKRLGSAHTPRAEYQCDSSTTHYQGCKCHEEAWHNRLDQERKEISTLRIAMNKARHAQTEISEMLDRERQENIRIARERDEARRAVASLERRHEHGEKEREKLKERIETLDDGSKGIGYEANLEAECNVLIRRVRRLRKCLSQLRNGCSSNVETQIKCGQALAEDDKLAK